MRKFWIFILYFLLTIFLSAMIVSGAIVLFSTIDLFYDEVEELGIWSLIIGSALSYVMAYLSILTFTGILDLKDEK